MWLLSLPSYTVKDRLSTHGGALCAEPFYVSSQQRCPQAYLQSKLMACFLSWGSFFSADSSHHTDKTNQRTCRQKPPAVSGVRAVGSYQQSFLLRLALDSVYPYWLRRLLGVSVYFQKHQKENGEFLCSVSLKSHLIYTYKAHFSK